MKRLISLEQKLFRAKTQITEPAAAADVRAGGESALAVGPPPLTGDKHRWHSGWCEEPGDHSGQPAPRDATTPRLLSNTEAAHDFPTGVLRMKTSGSEAISCGWVGWGDIWRCWWAFSAQLNLAPPWDLGQDQCLSVLVWCSCFLMWGNEANSIEYETHQGPGHPKGRPDGRTNCTGR